MTEDVAEFERLYKAHHSSLWRYAFGFVHSREMAEDIVQDVFLHLWDAQRQRLHDAQIRAYLYAATRNRALNILRHDRVAERTEAARAYEPDTPGMSTPAVPLDEAVWRAQLGAMLDEAIGRLSARQREAVTLRWKHELSYDEVSAIMGISIAAAQMHVSRAQADLRHILRRLRNE